MLAHFFASLRLFAASRSFFSASPRVFPFTETAYFRINLFSVMIRTLAIWTLLLLWSGAALAAGGPADRFRLIIETDAGGDPDDEQSLVRFLHYANEWDVEGIIANRPTARDGE